MSIKDFTAEFDAQNGLMFGECKTDNAVQLKAYGMCGTGLGCSGGGGQCGVGLRCAGQ